jgi:hypothetical protein
MFSRKLFWLFMMLLVITISDTNNIRDNAHPTYFNIFAVLFELSSAFGGVSLSIGYPGSSLSLSGQFNTFSKLVLIVAILAGRQRGLPTSSRVPSSSAEHEGGRQTHRYGARCVGGRAVACGDVCAGVRCWAQAADGVHSQHLWSAGGCERQADSHRQRC